VFPLDIGLGAMADAGLASLARRSGGALPLVVVSTGAAILSALGVTAGGTIGPTVDQGAEGGALLREANYPTDQTTAWYLGSSSSPSHGVLRHRRPTTVLPSQADVDWLAATAPNQLVLVDARPPPVRRP
jgi:hypothetical protein